MYPLNSSIWLLSLWTLLAQANRVSGVREVPERIVHSRASSSFSSTESVSTVFSTALTDTDIETKVKSKTDYIKEYTAYSSTSIIQFLSETFNAPLNSKFTNLERILSDDNDLRSWTRFIVDHDREESEIAPDPPSAESIDLSIDEFIEYLVEHRGFNEQDLQFLYDANVERDYDQVNQDLAAIKLRYSQLDDMEHVETSHANGISLGSFVMGLALFMILWN